MFSKFQTEADIYDFCLVSKVASGSEEVERDEEVERLKS